MIKKVFLDTNIVLDFLDKKRTNHATVQELIKYLTLHGYTIVISEDMLSTIFYIDKNKEKVLKFFKSILSNWEITSYGVSLIKNAINISLKNNLDLEDLLQCLCAKNNNCEVLITEDKVFFDCGITIYTANDFLKSR